MPHPQFQAQVHAYSVPHSRCDILPEKWGSPLPPFSTPPLPHHCRPPSPPPSSSAAVFEPRPAVMLSLPRALCLSIKTYSTQCTIALTNYTLEKVLPVYCFPQKVEQFAFLSTVRAPFSPSSHQNL